MNEQDKYQRQEFKLVSPLERVTQQTAEIAKLSELSETEYGQLRRYANIAYRTREIRNEFRQVSTKNLNFGFGEKDINGEEIIINVNRENYYSWIVMLEATGKKLINKYFDKNSKMTLARIQVDMTVEDMTNLPG